MKSASISGARGERFVQMVDLRGLRICFVAGSLGRGGAERQLYYMIRILSGLGVNCRVLSVTQGEEYEGLLRELGVPVQWIGRWSSPIARLAVIAREAMLWRPHIVQSSLSFTNIYAAVAARVTGAKSIGAVRSNGLEEFRRLGRFGTMCLQMPTILAGNSEQALIAIEQEYPARTTYFLPNAVDTDRFYPVSNSSSLAFNHNKVVVLNAGTLKQEKRQDLFIHAVAEARCQVPQLQARIVGNGPERAKLQGMINELDLRPHIQLTGASANMPDIYRQADMLVLTSDYEGMPNVVMEAMASGLPVISTRVGAAEDLIDSKTGYLCARRDVETLAQRIIDLSLNSLRRKAMGKEGRAKVELQYSLPILQQNLVELYDTVLCS